MRPHTNGSILLLGIHIQNTPESRGPTETTSFTRDVSEAIVADVFMSAIETITSKKRQLGDTTAMFGVGIGIKEIRLYIDHPKLQI